MERGSRQEVDWPTCDVRCGEPEICENYRREFREAALERFGWDRREPNLREAYSLYGLSANPFHQLHSNWYEFLETGPTLAAEALELQPESGWRVTASHKVRWPEDRWLSGDRASGTGS